MSPHPRVRTVVVILVLLVSSGVYQAVASDLAPTPLGSHARSRAAVDMLPVYVVKAGGATVAQGRLVRSAFGLPSNPRQTDGSLSFVDRKLFGALPMKGKGTAPADEDGTREVAVEAFDLKAINALEPFPAAVAMRRVERAFGAAGLPLRGRASIQRSSFKAFDFDGDVTAIAKPDTQVTYARTLGGFPVVGGGERAKVTFNSAGRVTYLSYASRTLERGRDVELLPEADADRIVRTLIEQGCAGRGTTMEVVEITSRLVYFSPQLSLRSVRKLVPHYEYGGIVADDEGEEFSIPQMLIPAIRRGGPVAALEATSEGDTVTVETSMTGGSAPYTYVYSSCTTPLTSEQALGGPDTSYRVAGRGEEIVSGDIVSVRVVDANGLVAMASAPVVVTGDAVPAPAESAADASLVGNVKDTGMEWIGSSQGLGAIGGDPYQMKAIMDGSVSTIRFFFSESSAWESDFKEPPNGEDPTYVDNVDLTWVNAHGNPNQVKLGGSGITPGDWRVHYSEANWGNGDLEWIAFQSCKVLRWTNANGLALDQRWVPTMQRLHLMLGFYTNTYVSWDIDTEVWAELMIEDNMKVGPAWGAYAEDEQYNGVGYRVIGLYGPGKYSNWGDHFHGQGSVTKDITTPTGWWAWDDVV